MINYPIESLMYINRFSKRGIPFEISKKYQGKDEQFHFCIYLTLSHILPAVLFGGPARRLVWRVRP